MRILVALVGLTLACPKTIPMKPLPVGAPWARGARAFVASNLAWKDTKSQLESHLRQAGFRLVDHVEGKGEVLIILDKYEDGSIVVNLERDGKRVAEIRAPIENLECGNFTVSEGCMAHGVANALFDSAAFVEAAKAAQSDTAVASAQPAKAAAPSTGKLAVLELRNLTADLTPDNAKYFTDMVRSTALRVQPGLEVMTRENLVVLLQATGKKLEECEGECEVDTGRRIGADQIVTGEIQKVGTSYKLSLRLHDTHAGRLLASQVASGKSVDELDAAAHKASEQLFAGR